MKTFVLGLIFFFLAGCGSDPVPSSVSSPKPDATSVTNFDFETYLKGTWIENVCIPKNQEEKINRVFMRREITFEENHRLTFVSRVFENPNCSKQLASLTYRGTYRLENDKKDRSVGRIFSEWETDVEMRALNFEKREEMAEASKKMLKQLFTDPQEPELGVPFRILGPQLLHFIHNEDSKFAYLLRAPTP